MKESENAFWCLCPFHVDTNPSMIVNKTGPYAGTYRCWACGAHGNAEELEFVRSAQFKKEFPASFARTVPPSLVDPDVAEWLADQWGVRTRDVLDFGHRTDGSSHLFPMYNACDSEVGAQRRLFSGRKLCVHGSMLGLFLPRGIQGGVRLVITEGLSDAVVAHHLGFHAGGKPSALACPEMVGHYCKNHAIPAVLFVSDNDQPSDKYADGVGREGARRSARAVWQIAGIPSAIVHPPKEFKDLREFYQREGYATATELLDEQLKRLE